MQTSASSNNHSMSSPTTNRRGEQDEEDVANDDDERNVHRRPPSTITVAGARTSLAAVRAVRRLDAEEPLPGEFLDTPPLATPDPSCIRRRLAATDADDVDRRQREPFPGNVASAPGGGEGGENGLSAPRRLSLPAAPASKKHPPFFKEPHDDDEHAAAVELPWSERVVHERDETISIAGIISEHALTKTEFSLRSTLMGFMPCAALVAAPSTQSFFVSQSFVLLGALIGSATTLGSAIAFSLIFLKGALFWLPFCTAMNAASLWEYTAAWNVVYAVTCFVVCVVGTGFTARLCLIFFNICMMAQQTANGQRLIYPSHGMLELLIGMGFGLVSVLLPRPMLSSRIADRLLQSMLAKDLVASFPAIHRALWARNTTERNVLARRLVATLKTMEDAFQQLQMQMVYSEYEMLFLSVLPFAWPSALRRPRQPQPSSKDSDGYIEGVEKYRGFGKGIREQQMRTVVCRTMKQLIFRTACLARVVELMKELDVIVPQTEQHGAHNATLMAALDRLTGHISHAIEVLASVPTRESAIAAIHSAELRTLIDEVHGCVNVLREDLFHNVDYREYERVQSVVGFYLFAVSQVVEVMEDSERSLKDDANFPSPWLVAWMFGWGSLTSTFTRLLGILRDPVTKPNLRMYTEAAKISGAMIASVRFFIFMNAQTAYLSGPSVIAFCAGDTFGETINGAFQRLSGVMFGCVVGYFADSYANTPTEKVASICTIFFVCNWLRDGKKYGGAAFYAAFNVLSMLSLLGAPKTVTTLTARIQQNTFAVLIYCAISILIWPAKPQQALREKRSRTIKALKDTFAVVLGMFSVPLSDSERIRQLLAELRAKRAAAVAEVEREFAYLTPAEEEPFCAALLFPVALNRDIYAAERRLLFTLDVFVGAWTLIATDPEKVMRPTLERFLLALAPTANDLATASRATANIVRELTLNPFASLTADLMIEGVTYAQCSHMLRDRLAEGFRAIVLRSQAIKSRRFLEHRRTLSSPSTSRGAADGAAATTRTLRRSVSEVFQHMQSTVTFHRRWMGDHGEAPLDGFGSPHGRHTPPIALSSSSPSSPHSAKQPLLPRDRAYVEFLESLSHRPEDAGEADDDAESHLGLVPARREDVLAIHSLKHAMGSYVEQMRTLVLSINDMHAFDAATNINPRRVPLLSSCLSML